MHLINTQSLQLEEHVEAIPRYVILSHTWGDQEVTYQEMDIPPPQRPNTTRQKAGYTKILTTCRLAQQRTPPIYHVWIDTCCIDKTSSACLTENINSMYEFYTRAEICLVYLVDLSPHVAFGDGLKHCKWITRGWTLQEMIASREIDFYGAGDSSSDWIFRGTKSQFCTELAQCTGVPRDVLNGRRSVASYSVARRMSWASARETTRPEDMAYCLLGIFGVNMPLIYGEREVGAFRRLQEGIIKKSNDMTIFAWEPISSGSGESTNNFCSIFAPSPANFRNSGMIGPWAKYSHDPQYTLTNKGLRMEETIYYVPEQGHRHNKSSNMKREYVLALGVDDTWPTWDRPHDMSLSSVSRSADDTSSPSALKMAYVGVHLRKIGPDLFMREERPLKRLSQKQRRGLAQTPDAPFYVLTDGDSLLHGAREQGDSNVAETLAQFREKGLRFLGQVSQINIIPQGLWDSMDRCFLLTRLTLVRGLIARIQLPPQNNRATAATGAGLQAVMSSTSTCTSKTVEMGVLMNWGVSSGYAIRLFDTADQERLKKGIFSFRHHRETKEGLRWREVEEQYPEIMGLSNELRVLMRNNDDGDVTMGGMSTARGPVGSVFVITASAVPEKVEGFYQNGQTVQMYRFVLKVKEQAPNGTVLREWDNGTDLLVRGQSTVSP